MGKQRKLTRRETARLEQLRIKEEQLREQGYRRVDLTVGIVAANILAIVVMLPFILLCVIAYIFVAGEGEINFFFGDMWKTGILLLIFFALIVLHELIHGAIWGFFAPGHFHDVEFGIIWSALTPYCTCTSELKKYQYIVGALMPTVLLGFLPAAAAIGMGNGALFLLSIFMILGGGGDFLIVGKLLAYRTKAKDVVILDHPSELGLIVFERDL